MSGHAGSFPEHPRGTTFLLASLGESFSLGATGRQKGKDTACLSFKPGLGLSDVWFSVLASKYKYGVSLSTQLRFRSHLGVSVHITTQQCHLEVPVSYNTEIGMCFIME